MSKRHKSTKTTNNKSAKPIPKFRTAIIIASLVAILLSGSALAYYIHVAMTNKQLNVAPKSNQASSNNDCLLSSSGCPGNTSSTTTQAPATSTPTPQTQPATNKPQMPQTVTTSPTCHYTPGYGEAYYRNQLVTSIQSSQTTAASDVNGTINQYNQYPGLMTSQQALSFVNSDISTFNNSISTSYGQYVSDVNSIGCIATIDTTNIPQVPSCTDLSGSICFNSLYAISIPSLE